MWNKNIRDIKNKIIKVLNNYNEISQNCINLVNRFDWEIITNQYIKIYNEMLTDIDNNHNESGCLT